MNHSLGFKDPITDVHTNTIEGSWEAMKAKIPKAYRKNQDKIVALFDKMHDVVQ